MKKKIPIKYKKERVILSDVLPYELPVTFSNRHLYKFLISHNVRIENRKVCWDKEQDPRKRDALEHVIKLLFGIPVCEIITNETISLENNSKTIPFCYKIAHKETDFRELTVIHPKNQVAVVAFYDNYKHTIMYNCNISNFSIRKAHKIARFTYFKDKTHIDNLAADCDHESTEQHDKEYEHLKTFFVYKHYSNIHKFYESYVYHQCEKKYAGMFKFDISRCFDSIYTHSVTWALLNKTIVKEEIPASKNTFGGKFDYLMQDLNYGETNGIIIGPEFSRIFAELILQQVDNSVLQILRSEKLYHKRDYEIFRYVDDFFIFFNNETTKKLIFETFQLQLKEYNLNLNESKTRLYQKPIITEITIAKNAVSKLINQYLTVKITENTNGVKVMEDKDVNSFDKGSLHVSSNKLITDFKTIIKETGIEYKDILNYSIASVDRKLKNLLKIHEGNDVVTNEKKVSESILEILDFTFFIYAVSPRVNTTIKLCMVLSKLIKSVKNPAYFNIDNKGLIFKKIYDELFAILRNNKNSEHTPVETLYLLIALRELGRDYRLSPAVLSTYFNIDPDTFTFNKPLNYLSTIILFFYMGDKQRYKILREELKKQTLKKYDVTLKSEFGKNAELVFLLFDLISCPYLDMPFKKKLLGRYGILDNALKMKIIGKQQYWFTKWSNFNFEKELEAKKSMEVY